MRKIQNHTLFYVHNKAILFYYKTVKTCNYSISLIFLSNNLFSDSRLVSVSLSACLKFLIALPSPLAKPGKRFPPNKRRRIPNTTINSQGPMPNILTPLDSESEILLAYALRCDRLRIHTALADFKKFVNRRKEGEPIAYITGVKEFYGREFIVNKHVLIPRPDTEKLIEIALSHIPSDRDFWIIDTCSGSGCIGITLALERLNVNVVMIDICPNAVDVIKQNIEKHRVNNRATAYTGYLLNPLKTINKQFDLLVANPPYIQASEIKTLSKDIRCFEPNIALRGIGKFGIGLHRKIISQSSLYLKPNSFILLEIGYNQGIYFRNLGKIIQDYSGNDRIVEIKNA